MRLISLLVIFIFFAQPVLAVVENLDETVARKDRRRTNTFYTGEGSSPYIWQPQSLSYTDVTTGAQVWKLSNAPAIPIVYAADINVPTWSADGKRMSIKIDMNDALNIKTAGLTGENGNNVWMLTNTDGSLLRPIINGSPSASTAQMQWFPWNPIEPDTYYMFGRPYLGVTGVAVNKLYKATITDSNITSAEWLDFSGTVHGSTAWYDILTNALSPDGQTIVATEGYISTQQYNYPAKVAPQAGKTLYGNGYSQDIPHDTDYWGGTPVTIDGYHSSQAQLALIDGVYRFISMPSDNDSAVQWMFNLTGSGMDYAPVHTVDRTAPYDFGEAWPLNVREGNNPYPSNHYISHPALDRWGKYMVYSDSVVPSVALFDVHSKSIYKSAYGASSQHHAWTAWSDYFIAMHGPVASSLDYTPEVLMMGKYDTDSSIANIAYPHPFYNNSNTYQNIYYALPRPTQSPDGTKASFHSTFLNTMVTTDTNTDVFWTVAYNPYPPFISAASATGGTVTITADWDLSGTPRGYTTRGWPDEATDIPPPPREISKFRLWRSTNGTTWTAVKTFDHDVWSKYDFSDGTWTGDDFWTTTDAVADGTYYYGITSLETSGLESQKLSNIKKIVVSGGTGTVTDHAAYPSAPGGKTAFYTTSPDAPTDATTTHKKTPATADGQYTIAWTAPTNKTLVRYYNIYAKDGEAPTAIQQTRIASIPATAADTAFSYVDWLGDTGGTTKYIITAVDYQGNESAAAEPAEVDVVAPVTSSNKSGRIAAKTSVTLTPNETATTLYCIAAAACTPGTTYSTAVDVRPNQYLCYKSTDTALNEETAVCQYFGWPLQCR